MNDQNLLWLDSLANIECSQPAKFLGLHPVAQGFELRAWYPDATAVEVLAIDSEQLLAQAEAQGTTGLFVAQFPTASQAFNYRLRVSRGNESSIVFDPFMFQQELHALSDLDINHYRLYQYYGAHLKTLTLAEGQSVSGVLFCLYAPMARAISLVGDFNGWDGRQNPMHKSDNGVWRLFVPGLNEGVLYKFEIKNPDGHLLPLKADPYGYWSESAPGNSSIVYDHSSYQWQDEAWQQQRQAQEALDKPLNIYEVHLGSWRRHEDGSYLNYHQLADELIPYAKEMGYTHLELLPVMEHPFDGSWGYQTVGMFAPTSRYGRPEDFKYFVDRCHQAGIGVILDWVPAHFPKDGHGLGYFDGTALYHEEDPRRAEHPDWGTLVYDYGRWYVRNFLISSALFWLDYFHIDGLRVDAVASMLYLDYSRKAGEWVPNIYGGNENLGAVEFLRQLNMSVYREYPGTMMIAEESTAWPMVSRPTYMGGLGFGLKWNMGWMHDTLSYMSKDPIHRQFHHGQLSFGLVYAFNENFVLPLSHDEVVHGKGSLLDQMAGDSWQKFANLRAYYGFMYGHPGKKLLFMGSEFAQGREWNHNTQLDWELLERPQHQGIQQLLKDLGHLYQSEPALYEIDFHHEGFEWLDFMDAQASVISFIRRGKSNPNEHVLVICNLTPIVRDGYRIGVPEGVAGYQELVNTDSQHYGGTNIGNSGFVPVEAVASHGRAQSINLKLPPLATVIFKART